MRPADTSADAQRHQDALFRAMTSGGRVEMAFKMSEAMLQLQQDGVRMRHPEYSDNDALMAAVRFRLADDKLFCAAYPDAPVLDP